MRKRSAEIYINELQKALLRQNSIDFGNAGVQKLNDWTNANKLKTVLMSRLLQENCVITWFYKCADFPFSAMTAEVGN